MQNALITSQDSQIVEIFQVEELEQRLENKWVSYPLEYEYIDKIPTTIKSTF